MTAVVADSPDMGHTPSSYALAGKLNDRNGAKLDAATKGLLFEHLAHHTMQLKDLFEAMDEDGNGHLSIEELTRGIEALGLAITTDQIRALVATTDADNSGTVEYAEILRTFGAQARDYVVRKQVRDAVVKVAFFTFIGVPIGMVITGLVFGGLLAWFEGWGFEDCFFIVLSELTQMEVQTIEHSYHPATLSQKLFANFIGLWCMIVFATILSVMAGPILLPLLRVIHMVPEEQMTGPKKSDESQASNRPDLDLLTTMQPEHLARYTATRVGETELVLQQVFALLQEQQRSSAESRPPPHHSRPAVGAAGSAPAVVDAAWSDPGVAEELRKLTHTVETTFAALSARIDRLEARLPPGQES